MIYNTKCDPLNNKINVPQLSPLPGMPGFGFNLNYKGPTLPSLEGIPEDIMKYVDMLKLALPGGAFLKHQIESLQQSISKIIASLLSYLNLFLGFYFMLLSIIELSLCIIQVLCGVPNPFSLVRRLKKLKRKCIPIFISICFPLFALLALLLALISILLALIEYIIALVKRFIEQLLKNVKRLKFILQQGNSDAALAIIAKIGDLMCLFEHVFVLLGAIDTIMELIKTKWKKILKVCSAGGGDGDGVDELDQTDQAYEESCCGAICANFLSNPESQIDDPFEIWKSRVKGRLGQINYTNKVLGMPYPSLPTTIVPVRDEAIYFIDDFLDSTLTFNNIISSPSIEGIMFPFFPPSTITAYTERGKIPYFIDISFGFNPEDGHGARLITITDCIITNVILDAPMYVAGGVVIPEHNDKGFLALIGGIFIDELGRQYTLLDIMRKIVGQPGTDPNADGNSAYTYMTDVIFQLKINYNALLDYMLITIDCLPSMILEDKFLSTSMYKPLHVSLGGTGGPNGLGGPDGTGDVVKNISGVLPDGTVRVIPPGGIILPDGSIVPGPGGPYFEKIPAEEILTPEQAAEKASKGTLGGLNSDGVIDITLPDVAGALQQLENSLNSYRNDITEESTAQLETILNDILIRLQKQANTRRSI